MKIRDKDRLTAQQERFCLEFVKRGNATEAFRVAYDCSRMKDKSVNTRAHHVSNNPKVKLRIEQLQDDFKRSTAIAINEAAQQRVAASNDVLSEVVYGALQVFQHWQDIALADPNKIVRHRRLNCRHCHGVDHRYQWEDREEFARALADMLDINLRRARMKPRQSPLALPTDKGGYGWAFNAPPHPECPKCRGEGTPDVFVTDTGLLDPRERKLYKGTRVTKNGIEILMHDQMEALVNIGKILGMFTEKIKLVDPDAKTDLPALPLDATEASRVYAAFIKGES